jgi:hypothetical protein
MAVFGKLAGRHQCPDGSTCSRVFGAPAPSLVIACDRRIGLVPGWSGRTGVSLPQPAGRCRRLRANRHCSWWVLRVAAFALLTTGPAVREANADPRQPPAQTSAGVPTPLDVVTVTARSRLEAQKLQQEILPQFIKSHAVPANVTGQISRWRTGVCPLTRGLSSAFTDFISTRLRAVAATVGAPVDDRESCEHNVEIIFTTEPQKLLDDVVEKHWRMLGFHYLAQEKQLATISRPVQAWYVTASRGAKGEQRIDDIFGAPPGSRLGSRFGSGMSSVIVFVLVVADTNKVAGYTAGAISDYVTMLALSHAQSLDGCTDLPSILDILSSSCGNRAKPDAMTPGDNAYLRALYAADLELTLPLERSDINNRMMRELEGR